MDRSVPIPTVHLFPVLDKLLIGLLRSLSPEDWNKRTLASKWTVKDIAAHLLDGNMRTISAQNNYTPNSPQNIKSYQDLVDYLNELNGVWVKAMERVSPAQLIDLLESTGMRYSDYQVKQDPFTTAIYPVSWAGEIQSVNWFHIAREYTEKWHHQQQIREAVGKTDALMTRELFYPCIDTLMCGLPNAYRDIKADTGSVIKITIYGDAGGDWYLLKTTDNWILDKCIPANPIKAFVSIPSDISWKLFTKGVNVETAIKESMIEGDSALAENVFRMVSVMA